MLCKYVIHFSFIGKKNYFFARSANNLYIFTIKLPSSLPHYGRSNALPYLQMPLPKRRHMLVNCLADIYVSCSGLQSSNFYYDWFSCIQCTHKNFAKGSNSTNRPRSLAPITTQEEISPATRKTNVQPNAYQSQPSSPR